MSGVKGSPRRVAIVTGCAASGGIGAAIARRLVKDGRAVLVCDLSATGVRGVSADDAEKLKQAGGAPSAEWRGLESLVDEIRAQGGEADWAVGDVTVEADAERIAREAVEKLGGLDILVNNASAPQYFRDIEEMEQDGWERVQAVNITGPYLMTKHAAKHMRQNRWGRIVNIVSIISEDGGPAKESAHTASKAALAGFTRAVSRDLGPDGITVNGVSPSLTLTDRGKAIAIKMFGDDPDAGAKQLPMRRFGRPEDIAGMVNYLASEEAGFVTAQVIRVDGGAPLVL